MLVIFFLLGYSRIEIMFEMMNHNYRFLIRMCTDRHLQKSTSTLSISTLSTFTEIHTFRIIFMIYLQIYVKNKQK